MDSRALDARVREIVDELALVRLNAPSCIGRVVPAIYDLLELESLVFYSLRSRTGHWLVDRWKAAGPGQALEVPVRRLCERSREFPMIYDPHRPVKAHRNRVIDAFSRLEKRSPDKWHESTAYREVFVPVHLHHHCQPRVLLRDGPETLAWFGAFHPSSPSRQQLRLLATFIAPLRQRFSAERRLEETHARRTLDALLENIGAPTFLIDARGRIHEVNAAGRVLLDERRAETVAALQDATAGRASALRFELQELRDHGNGSARAWLAVLKPDTNEARIDICVDAAKRRLGLTPRQTAVLALVIRGKTNSTIAALLECVERTVELHVTALLDRFGVDSRAGLVAATLMHD